MDRARRSRQRVEGRARVVAPPVPAADRVAARIVIVVALVAGRVRDADQTVQTVVAIGRRQVLDAPVDLVHILPGAGGQVGGVVVGVRGSEAANAVAEVRHRVRPVEGVVAGGRDDPVRVDHLTDLRRGRILVRGPHRVRAYFLGCEASEVVVAVRRREQGGRPLSAWGHHHPAGHQASVVVAKGRRRAVEVRGRLQPPERVVRVRLDPLVCRARRDRRSHQVQGRVVVVVRDLAVFGRGMLHDVEAVGKGYVCETLG